MFLKSKSSAYLFFLFVAVVLMAPVGFLYAETPAPTPPAGPTQLAPLPSPPNEVLPTKTGLAGYLQTLFWLAITLAGVLAVLMIVKGGVLYMTSEAFNTKAEAKKQITMAIVGFLLAISSVLILTTINPDLLKFKLTVRPITFPIPPPLAAGSIPGCTSAVQPPVVRCEWALSGGTCSTSIMGAYNNWIDAPDSDCSGDKPISYRCCKYILLNNGCTGIGINAGKKECIWSSPGLGDQCTNAPFVTTHPGFQQGELTYCTGTRPGVSGLGYGSDCCVK